MDAENPPGDETPFPWPRAGDVMFQSGDDWCYNACVNYKRGSWELYASGYKDAADIICGQVFEIGAFPDFLIYPVAYLYRHYLELRLKQMIVAGQELLDQTPNVKHIHRIDVLWQTCRKILKEVWPNSSRDALDAVEACIKQFSIADPRIYGFSLSRYERREAYPAHVGADKYLQPTRGHGA